ASAQHCTRSSWCAEAHHTGPASQWQLNGRYLSGRSVRSMPCTFMLVGALARAQTQATGTTCESSMTAGRRLKVLPLIAPLAWLPKVMCSTPASIVTALTRLLTILSGAGKPAAVLSAGSVLLLAEDAATGVLANSAHF